MDTLRAEELAAALAGVQEDQRDMYRAAAYPVFLQHAKKGERWTAFLHQLGLGSARKPARRSKPVKSDMSNVYNLAEHIKAHDQGSR